LQRFIRNLTAEADKLVTNTASLRFKRKSHMRILSWLVVLAFLAGSFVNCKPAAKATSKPATEKAKPAAMAGGKVVLIPFVDSETLMPVLERAKQEKKLVFLDFHAKWCMPCKIVEENVFTSKDATTDLNVNFLSLKVDVDKSKGADIAAIYEVEALPTLLFLNANGEVLERRIGAVGVEDFKKLTRAAMAKGGKS